MIRKIFAAAIVLGLAACSPPSQTSTEPSAAPSVAALPSVPPPMSAAEAKKAAATTDAWIGKWVGVEGNFLDIQAGSAPGLYAITEQTLDGPKTYVGTSKEASIDFVEDGKTLSILAGQGDETHLKYLAGKTNCLIITGDRAFCR